MRPATTVFLMLLASLALPEAGAAVLYKLTDGDGKVTYVDVVPKGYPGTVQRLDIDTDANPMAAPKPPVIRAEPAVRGETDYERIIRRRPDTSADDRIQAARAKVEAARQALEAAQSNSTPDDYYWFGPRNPVGMRRAPKPEYLARLQQLEGNVAAAEDQLRTAERGDR